MPNQPEPERLRIGEAARFLGVSPDTLRRWEKAGRITATRTLGGERRYLRTDLEALTDAPVAAITATEGKA